MVIVPVSYLLHVTWPITVANSNYENRFRIIFCRVLPTIFSRKFSKHRYIRSALVSGIISCFLQSKILTYVEIVSVHPFLLHKAIDGFFCVP
jgi:hypothetical protein